MREDEITSKVIGAGIEVHKVLGPGLSESAYEECLCYELSQIGLAFERQVDLPVIYKGVHLDCGYRMDLVVENSVIVEIKAVEQIIKIHEAQLLSYLKLYGKTVGLLLNFHSPILKNGLKRIVNNFLENSASPRLGGEKYLNELLRKDEKQ
ncbi:MAG TPA: GxxExxY protein [Pyrinomonadaceae bacterium]|jgi:GxxExxY protein